MWKWERRYRHSTTHYKCAFDNNIPHHSVPMEQFVRREVKEIKKKRSELQKNILEYENDLAKYLQLKNNEKESVISQHMSKIASSKRAFELVRFDLVNLLNQLEMKKKFQLVERICSGLYANLGFFHQVSGRPIFLSERE